MSDNDGIYDEFDQSPRPAKRQRISKTTSSTVAKRKAKKPATKEATPKQIFKSAEFVNSSDSDSDLAIKPAPKSKRSTTAATTTKSSGTKRLPAPRKPWSNAKSKKPARHPTPSSESISSDDAFEAAVKPAIVPRAIRAVESDSEDRSTKAKKPKHRIHDPISNSFFVDRWCAQSQVPPESSDPSAVRGPIWIKVPTPKKVAEPRVAPVIAAGGAESSKPVVGEAMAKTGLSTARIVAGDAGKAFAGHSAAASTRHTTGATGDPLATASAAGSMAPPLVPARTLMPPPSIRRTSTEADTRSSLLPTHGDILSDRLKSPSDTSKRKPSATDVPEKVKDIEKSHSRAQAGPFLVDDDDVEDFFDSDLEGFMVDSALSNTHTAEPQSKSASGALRPTLKIDNVAKKIQTPAPIPAARLPSRPASPSEKTGTESLHEASILTAAPRSNTGQADRSGGPSRIDETGAEVINLLADVPSDAFSSDDEFKDSTTTTTTKASTVQPQKSLALGGLSTGFRQTTLHGSFSAPGDEEQGKAKKTAWPLANREEKPTHHELNKQAIETWVYPTNLGTIRDYQYSIVQAGLFNNTLVALPTGLGKTFIAATIMLNWYRWTKGSQIIFVAPTKPLVSQQVEACFHTVGIPRSDTAMLTGTITPALRAEAWEKKRVFFMTPQTMGNDLRSGICDPKRVVLLVVDEAHRATGNYSYVDLVRFLRRFNTSFRILALTATPGAKIETVQEVIDGLSISRVEIRTEQSLDIRQYVHSRETETFLFDYSDEQNMIMELFSKALKPAVDRLTSQNAYWLKDPMKLTAFGLTQAQRQWQASETGRKASQAIKGMMFSTFKVLASLAHGISLLKYHGIGPFNRRIVAFKKQVDEGELKGKIAAGIRADENFTKMDNYIRTWLRNPDFIGHPKLEYLRSVILNHFMDAGETGRAGDTPSATRVMVFAQYRDSAEQIVSVLRRNEPMLRPHVFVGQASAEGSAGMDQKTQLDVIEKFKSGTYNTLVATSIGEEGLDIGEVDLIICFDANASPIRMLQRMGRTGRKRRGKIVLLLMREKEQTDFAQAKDNYEKMQGMIASGKHFNFHDEQSPRILPKDVRPAVDKRVVEIPVENSQADLPEPKKGGRKPKRPPKKFHMPDGVITGFVKALNVNGDGSEAEIDAGATTLTKSGRKTQRVKPAGPMLQPEPSPTPLPFLEDVLLNKMQEKELARKYQYVTSNTPAVVLAPRPDDNLAGFRNPGPIRHVPHGRYAKSISATLRRMQDMDGISVERFRENFNEADLQGDIGSLVSDVQPAMPDTLSDSDAPIAQPKAATKSRGKQVKTSIRPEASDSDASIAQPTTAPSARGRMDEIPTDPASDSDVLPEPAPKPRGRPKKAPTKPASDSDASIAQPAVAAKSRGRASKAAAKPKAPSKAKAAPKARAPKPAKNAPAAPSRARGRARAGPGNSSDMEGSASDTPEPTPREYAIASQAISLGEADTSGDDAPQGTLDYRLDSDLASFVVGSDQIEFASSSAGPMALMALEERTPGRGLDGKGKGRGLKRGRGRNVRNESEDELRSESDGNRDIDMDMDVDVDEDVFPSRKGTRKARGGGFDPARDEEVSAFMGCAGGARGKRKRVVVSDDSDTA